MTCIYNFITVISNTFQIIINFKDIYNKIPDLVFFHVRGALSDFWTDIDVIMYFTCKSNYIFHHQIYIYICIKHVSFMPSIHFFLYHIKDI